MPRFLHVLLFLEFIADNLYLLLNFLMLHQQVIIFLDTARSLFQILLFIDQFLDLHFLPIIFLLLFSNLQKHRSLLRINIPLHLRLINSWLWHRL